MLWRQCAGDTQQDPKGRDLNQITSSQIPGFSTSDLLTDIFSELLGPIIIIGRDRRIIFKSRSFEDIVGLSLDDGALSCDLIILPSPSGCCIEAIDNYPADIGSGIWNVKRPDGSIVPVLATWRSVNIGSQLSLLAIQCTPIQSSASPVSLSFFQGIRQSTDDETVYMRRTADYLQQTLGCGAVAWIDMSASRCRLLYTIGLSAPDARVLERSLEDSCCRTQDILVAGKSGHKVYHNFTNCTTNRKISLVVGKMRNDISASLIDTLTASVAAALCQGKGAQTAFKSDSDFQSTYEAMTPAEADIMDKLLLGMTDKEIALLREVSHFTVKNQVKRVLKKAGTNRRVDLIRRFGQTKVRGNQM